MRSRKRLRSRGRRGSGFTLLELLITTGVMMVAIAGLLQLFVGCLWQSESSGKLTGAMAEAYGKWEEVQATNFDNIIPNFSKGGVPGNVFPLATTAGNGAVYLQAISPDVLQVDIVVSWRDKGNDVVGEDKNLNGILDGGEDLNNNGRLDSPTSLTALIARR